MTSDSRKLALLQADLQEMASVLLPGSASSSSSAEPALSAAQLAKLDAFHRAKYQLNSALHALRPDVERLSAMRERLGPGQRDADSIRLCSENSGRLQAAAVLFDDLRRAHKKAEAKALKSDKPSSARLVAEHRELVRLLGEDLASLTKANSPVRPLAFHEGKELDDLVQARAEERRREAIEAIKAKRARTAASSRGRRSSGGGHDVALDVFDDGGVDQAQSEREVAFDVQVAKNVTEQNALLDQIAAGLAELEQLANAANVALSTQQELLGEVDGRMNVVIVKFKSANKRMKQMLEQSGGMSRWCPILICCVILLSLLGVILKFA